ncbi:MAG: hypothetical protein AB7F89_23770, partial [Pirellulaceae bacterium]
MLTVHSGALATGPPGDELEEGEGETGVDATVGVATGGLCASDSDHAAIVAAAAAASISVE